MATCTLKTNFEKLQHQLKQFTLVSAIKVVVDEQDTYSQIGVAQLSFPQYSTYQVDLSKLPRHANLSAVTGDYHIIASRKAVRKLLPYEVEFCKQFTRYKDYCLEVLCTGTLQQVTSNIALADISASTQAKFVRKPGCDYKIVYELAYVVLNGTDLLLIVKKVYNCLILFKAEVCGFKSVEGEIIIGQDQFGIVELTYEYMA